MSNNWGNILNLRELDKIINELEIESTIKNFIITNYNKNTRKTKIITGRGINSPKKGKIKTLTDNILSNLKKQNIITSYQETDLGGSYEIWC